MPITLTLTSKRERRILRKKEASHKYIRSLESILIFPSTLKILPLLTLFRSSPSPNTAITNQIEETAAGRPN